MDVQTDTHSQPDKQTQYQQYHPEILPRFWPLALTEEMFCQTTFFFILSSFEQVCNRVLRCLKQPFLQHEDNNRPSRRLNATPTRKGIPSLTHAQNGGFPLTLAVVPSFVVGVTKFCMPQKLNFSVKLPKGETCKCQR